MLAIDARETAPASATQQMYQNNTGDYTGIAQFIIIVRIIIFCVVDFFVALPPRLDVGLA